MDRNLGINAFRVELLGVVALFEILANVNGIGGVYRHSRRRVQTDCYRQFCHKAVWLRYVHQQVSTHHDQYPLFFAVAMRVFPLLQVNIVCITLKKKTRHSESVNFNQYPSSVMR